MSHPAIGRFFSPLQALISLGIGAAGLVCGGLVAYRYLDAHRINITFALVAAGLLLLAPVYFLVQAFPKGCKTCKKAFATKSAAFPTGWKEVVQRFLAAPDQATWQQLCQAPLHGQSDRALLSIEHCATCGKIGQAELVIEEARDGEWNTRDYCEERVVDGPMVVWLIQLADARNAT